MAPLRFAISRFASDGLGVGPWDPPQPLSQRTPPAHCDVLVVGAGITGLAVALSLANRQREVVVLEDAFGTGATSRSGGIVIGETAVGPAPGFDGCEQTLRQWIVASGIRCDLAWNGCLELARDLTLSARPIDWRDGGSIRMAAEVPGGVLDPAKLLTGFANVVSQAGVPIVDGVTVHSVEGGSGEIRLKTSRGMLGARQVVMAIDATGWKEAFDPWEERSITAALQTTAVESDALAAIGLQQDQAFYTRDQPFLWGRVMLDRSLLIGRELLPFPWGEAHDALTELMTAAGVRLLSRIRGLHPAMSALGARRIWGGPIGRTVAGVPTVVRDPDYPQLIWAGGYGGHGLAQAFRLGTMVGDYLTS